MPDPAPLSRAEQPGHPDRLVLDLDPPGPDFTAVRDAALRARELLDQLGLPAAVMTTGSKGAHVIVPLDGTSDFDASRDFARRFADVLAERHPDRLTTAVRKQSRGNRLYLDVQRNAYAQTAVAPWSVRPKAGAPVAAPLTWEQLGDRQVTARTWSLRDVRGVLEQARSRPWPRSVSRGRSLRAAARRLDALR